MKLQFINGIIEKNRLATRHGAASLFSFGAEGKDALGVLLMMGKHIIFA